MTSTSASRATDAETSTCDDARLTATYLCSYPKSGRTWMRYGLARYLRDVHSLDLDIDLHTIFRLLPNLDGEESWSGKGIDGYAFADRPEVPLVLSSHLPYTPERFGGQRVVLLIRSPLDVAVSRYQHATRHDPTFAGGIAAFIHDEQVGVADHLRHLNGWVAALPGVDGLVLSYEELRADPQPRFAALIAHLTNAEPDAEAARRALDSASVERMRAVERASGVKGYDYDRDDVEALRVRRGVVGGYAEYLSGEDAAWIQATCAARLMPATKRLLHEHAAVV